jgi:hypothetical protein
MSSQKCIKYGPYELKIQVKYAYMKTKNCKSSKRQQKLTYSFRAVGNQEEFHKKEGQLIDF